MINNTLEKACKACAIAKRRCGKQTPHCQRCRQRGIDCSYPPSKPSCYVLATADNAFQIGPKSPNTALQVSAYYPDYESVGANNAGSSLSSNPYPLVDSLIDEGPASSWFASQETWNICFPQLADPIFSVTDMNRFISKLHRWLAEWVEKGSNPFIHARLYRNRMPQCIQDTYGALSCYLHKTESNKQIVFQIIENRAKHLIAEHGISSSQGDKDTSSKNLDSLEHIARVQSLLIYQLIGLYDGDIRLRYLAESYSPILKDWMKEMVINVSQVADLGGAISSSVGDQGSTGRNSSSTGHTENLLWHAWILAESVRRTWVVGSSILVVFAVLQQTFCPPCQGGMMITTRKGVWEAQSAMAWEKLCSEVHVGLMQMAEIDRLFTEFGPDEVNEFTKVVLGVVFGPERMERWGVPLED